ncbi:hypothetical protein VSR01_16120 [Actinacidiphila sp. DG2A-62]|uniref:hypothetical protein n=1 Tax=Actinacidiphila sp. DG2A-62 TaxID=3108821 RepID=UPI002DBF8847|nr:hypothetical protein [Actinacidiphila sp. DG2A-62]MEC3994971.1 hypothetical protein [Actinacidiphila sp. DG2A-62]
MARCGCGGGQSGAQITAGDNVAVSGTGSAANPYVISAQTDCTEVRGCLHGGAGVAYDPATGVFSAALSGQAGNNVTVAPDGGLFVPTGAATVSTRCGLAGDGSGSAPLTVPTSAWPYACDIDANAGDLFCDSAGQLRADLPPRLTYVEDAVTTSFANVPVPAGTAIQPAHTDTLVIPNPDPCRPAVVIYETEADVSFDFPVGSAAAAGMGGDEMQFFANRGTTSVLGLHWQMTKVQQRTIPAGATLNEPFVVSIGRGGGGATYTRVQTQMRAWIFNL